MKLRVNEAAPVKMRLDTACPASFLPLLLTESLGKVGVSGSTAVSVKNVQVEGVDPYDALLVIAVADELKIPASATAYLVGTASLVWLAGSNGLTNKSAGYQVPRSLDIKVNSTGTLYSTCSSAYSTGIYASTPSGSVSSGHIVLRIMAKATSCVIDNDYTVRVYGINIAHLLNFLFTEGE